MGDALGRLRITEAPRWPQPIDPDQPQDRDRERLVRALRGLRLKGMAKALERQGSGDGAGVGSFEDLLALMVQEESRERAQRRIMLRLRQARLRYRPVFREVDFNLDRGLDRAYFLWLAKGEWLKSGDNLIISGPVGVGKTFLACALARRFCLQGHSALYLRTPELWPELTPAREKRGREKFRRKLLQVDLLILDDWGLGNLEEHQKQELAGLLDERCGRRSTLVVSPLGVEDWPGKNAPSALDQALLDRLLNQAHFLELRGQSVRRLYAGRSVPGDSN